MLGYVLFMGSLVAIMTQWLNRTLKTLENGITPIAVNDHVLVLGSTELTATILGELFEAESRVEHFLRRQGSRRLHMVVLSQDSGTALLHELRSRVGQQWTSSQVTLRQGSPLRAEHLARVDFSHASVVLVPAQDVGEIAAEAADLQTIKTLLSMSSHESVDAASDLPLAVVELLDERKVGVARAAYPGPLEIISSDALISRLLAQTIRHRGLSRVYNELFAHGAGNQLYVCDVAEVEGASFQQLAEVFDTAVPLGFCSGQVGETSTRLNPPGETVYQPGERIVFLAHRLEDTRPSRAVRAFEFEAIASAEMLAAEPRRILVLGWSHRVPPLLGELAQARDRTYSVAIASMVQEAERNVALERSGVTLDGLDLTHYEVDYTLPSQLSRLKPGSYDRVVIVGSDWVGSSEEADARTVVGHLMLSELLASDEADVPVVVELLDASNEGLLGNRGAEVAVVPILLGRMLAQVALRRELNQVFENLLGSGATDVTFRSPNEYGYAGSTTKLDFPGLQRAAAQRGEVALGFLLRGERAELHLNPGRTEIFSLTEEDELVVMTTFHNGAAFRPEENQS